MDNPRLNDHNNPLNVTYTCILEDLNSLCHSDELDHDTAQIFADRANSLIASDSSDSVLTEKFYELESDIYSHRLI